MPDSPPIGSPPVHASIGGRLRGSVLADPGLPISLLFFAGAVLVALSALIHLHLWSTGYKQIHTIGPLFLLQAITSFMVAGAVAASRHYLMAAAGALFVAGTIAGLVISIEVGLFGFQDSFGAPYATCSLIVEALAAVVLGSAAFTARRRGRLGIASGRGADGTQTVDPRRGTRTAS